MIPIIPIISGIAAIIGAVKPLVETAEETFAKTEAVSGPQGSLKKAFVLEALGKLFDGLKESGRIAKWIPRDVVMSLCAWMIDVIAGRLFPNA